MPAWSHWRAWWRRRPIRREQSREYANQGGLAGSVRPEQSEDRPFGDVEVDTREGDRPAEALGHAAG
jgi:hypothetical protein